MTSPNNTEKHPQKAEDYTTLRVQEEVRDDLDTVGKHRESFNVIIKRLIKFFRKNNTEENDSKT